jgi:hypothetical protein
MTIEATAFSANKLGGNVFAVSLDHNDDTAVASLAADPALSELRGNILTVSDV